VFGGLPAISIICLHCYRNEPEFFKKGSRSAALSEAISRRQGSSRDGDLDVVDRGQRIEQAIPMLAALPPDPQVTGRRAEVECG